MAGLNLFNPASLLSSPDVAVAQPPVTDATAAVFSGLTSALQGAKDQVKKYRDLQALKQETNNIADYVEDRSPQLSSYLRDKAASYGLQTTNVDQERAGLLQGVIGLSRIEQADRKLDNDQKLLKLEDTWKNKLTASGKRLEAMLVDRQRWDAEENDAFNRAEARRVELAKEGISSPSYVKRPYPREEELKKLQETDAQLTEAGPDKIASMQIPSQRSSRLNLSGNNGGVEVTEPDLPTGEYNANNQPLLLGTPPPGSQYDPSTESKLNLVQPPKAEVVTEAPAANPPNLSLAPVQQQDSIDLMANRRAEEIKQSAAIAQKTVDEIIDRALNIKQYYDEPKLVDNIAAKRDSIKKTIADLPNPGSSLWVRQVSNILSALEKDIEIIPKRTAVQEQKQQEELNKATLSYYIAGDKSKTPVTIIKRQRGGQDKYYAKNNYTGNEDDVTLQVLKGEYLPLGSNDKVDVTKPGAMSVPDVINTLRNLPAQ